MEQALYIRIADTLRQNVLNGRYMPNDALPSESVLVARYGTSRVTVRKAMGLLEAEGIIRAERGKGYFVQPPRHTLFTLVYSDAVAAENSRYQEVNLVQPDRDVAEALMLKKTQPAIVTRRIILRDGEAVAFDEKYIPYVRGEPSIELELNLTEFPDMFSERYASMSLRTKMEIGLEKSPLRVCRALRMLKAENMMVVKRLILSPNNEPVAYGKLFASSGFGTLRAEAGYSNGE